jgi:pyruvate/2-oxoglutarate dehydrogenase complex dihydrolipoamide acyltransferase (E2) component
MSGDDDRVPVVADGDWADDVDADEGVVVNWFATAGRSVAAGESLCEIQIEKVSVDVTAPVAGELVEVVRGENDEFSVGETLAWIRPD